MNFERVTVVGGTGALGSGLVGRLVRAGISVVIGSRSEEKALSAAKEISEAGPRGSVTGNENIAAAQAGDVVIVTVPFVSQVETLRSIAPVVQGKIVIDTTVPLVAPKVARVQLPEAGSAAAVAVKVLGSDVRLVTAFHNVSAQKLRSDERVDCDVLVFSDDVEARDSTIDLIGRLGMRGLHGGVLENSAAAEAMTSVLISINKRYKVSEGAGIVITGLGDAGQGG